MKRRRLLTLAACTAAWLGGPAAAPAAPASPAAGHARKPAAARAVWPVANFLVEWRIRRAPTAAVGPGGWVIGSDDAATGRSGFGPGAVVVGTDAPARPEGVRVSNGREAVLLLDRSSRRTVYDLTWTSTPAPGQPASTAASAGGSSGAAGHEVVVHAVDSLRVTPHWRRGDSLALDLEVRHADPEAADGDAGAYRQQALALHTTVQMSIGEWQTIATLGQGGDELQVRVAWR